MKPHKNTRTLKEIRADIAKLQKEAEPLEESLRREQLIHFVGKCFKYRNSYGSGEEWWLYTRVLDYKDGQLRMFRFQRDCYGRFDFEPDHRGSETSLRVPITRGEFERRLTAELDRCRKDADYAERLTK